MLGVVVREVTGSPATKRQNGVLFAADACVRLQEKERPKDEKMNRRDEQLRSVKIEGIGSTENRYRVLVTLYGAEQKSIIWWN
jgi:hypothetical protein